ncbi:MAG: type VI secretion system baseplate subunit TssE [Planctomycetota bacterium]|nr:type VI secretion system baseplate subunit TssE [Planctomycetota bacterium]
MNPPKFPRDLLWVPANLAMVDGSTGAVFLPGLYLGSNEHGLETVRLGRERDWMPVAAEYEGLMRGYGPGCIMEAGDLRKLGLMPSVLDRMINPDSLGTRTNPGFTIAELITAVRRDVEELFNTRQNQDKDIDLFPMLADSVYRFGLPEVVSLQASSPEDRLKIARMLERAITRHEPRLSNVRVKLVTDEKSTRNSTLNYRIEARVRLDPAPEVVFETLLELATGQTRVAEAKVG